MSAGSSHLEVDDDEGGEQITVLVRVGDTELRARVRRALACSAVLLEIDDDQ